MPNSEKVTSFKKYIKIRRAFEGTVYARNSLPQREFPLKRNKVIDLKARLRRWVSESWKEESAKSVYILEDQKVIDIEELYKSKALQTAADIIIGNFEASAKRSAEDTETLITETTAKVRQDYGGLSVVQEANLGSAENNLIVPSPAVWRRNRFLALYEI